MSKISFILTLCLASFVCFSQKSVTISGKIEGLTNSVIYLGNKSLNYGYKYLVFDSVYSNDGGFEFLNFKFKETDFFSIQYRGSQSWLTFIIDTGHIFVTAKKDSLPFGKVMGSYEDDFFHSYSKDIMTPYFIANRSDSDSIYKYMGTDSSLFIYYSNLREKVESEYIKNCKKFIEQHPENYVSLIILKGISDYMPPEQLQFYFNLLSQELQQHSKAVKLRKQALGN